MPVHNAKHITGRRAVEIERSVEDAIRRGELSTGDALPPIRACAAELGVSPATVSSAYRALRERGLVVSRGRGGTFVTERPPIRTVAHVPLPAHAKDLATGNPALEVLPDLAPALAKLDPPQRLYGEEVSLPELITLERELLRADGIAATHLTITSGALDGIERALLAHLRPGDRVAIEDPAFSGISNLLATLGLPAVPVAIDDSGMQPDALRAALASGVSALIVTPRAQNPTGAALDRARVRALRKVLAEAPDVLLIEDDHAGPVAGVPALTLTAGRDLFAVVRSHSKALGPDLRVAVLTGDERTVARIEGRQQLGMRWVSHVLQRLVVAIWEMPGRDRLLRRAARRYTLQRRALIDALATHGIGAHGRSGLNVWIPVPEESAVVSGLLERGWAVSAGERFRIATPPAIRVSIADLAPRDAKGFASDLAAILAPATRTHTT